MEISANKAFDIATKFIQYTDSSIFLTGKAGTGKTTFLHYIKKTVSKKMAIVAPTGVAAINAGGVTIHSFFNLPFGLYIPNHLPQWQQEDSLVLNKEQLLKRLKFNSNKRTLIKELELLIIDEVSMARADIIDAIDAILKHVRKQPQKPFGGVQVIYIGDLYQLPPVVKEQDAILMESYYESPFFFHAQVLQQFPPTFIELEKIYRQQDATFINLLNNIRNNTCTTADFEILNAHYQPYFTPTEADKYITLCSHNYLADTINQNALADLPNKNVLLEAVVTGEFPASAYPTDATIHLKVGAQIMFIKNDKGESRRYYNGKLAIVQAIHEENGQITVAFENEKELLIVEKEVWNNVRYEFNREQQQVEEVILGSFTQFPIRLAWAITIHKSQGLTFDKAVIDASKAFAPGQVYVAISRLTNLEGMVLKSHITPQAIKTDNRITTYSLNKLPQEELDAVLNFEQTNYIKQCIINAFNLEKILFLIDQLDKDYTNTVFYNTDLAQESLLSLKNNLNQIQNTGLQFQQQLQSIIKPIEIAYNPLLERLEKGQEWFQSQLNDKLISILEQHNKEIAAITKTKKYFKDIQYIIQALKNIVTGFDVAVFYALGLQNNIPADKLIQTAKEQFYAKKQASLAANEEIIQAKSNIKSNELSLQMYSEGMSIMEIAEKRNIIASTVNAHLIQFIATGEIDVHTFVAAEQYPLIKACIEANPQARLGDLKALLGDAYAYDSIKAVIEDLKRQID